MGLASARFRARLYSTNEADEIAALEKRLAELKGNAEAEASAPPAADGAADASVEGDSGGSDDDFEEAYRTKLASEGGKLGVTAKNLANRAVAPPVELLSEQWKVGTETGGGGGGGVGGLVPVLGAIALVVALVGFSQVPIGSDDIGIPRNDGEKQLVR